MCTVSFIPTPGKVFITSNRDENALRPRALAPFRQKIGKYSFVAPTDALAGGTWIALRNDGSAMVLLNGAWEKHLPLPIYRKSRGQAFWDVFATDCPLATFAQIDLGGIEPFTLVLWQNKELHDLRWDGKGKSKVQKDPRTAHIWSSCTLYERDSRMCREIFFYQWLAAQREYSATAIHDFHLHQDPAGKEEKDIRIDRNGNMLTVSVSCIEMGPEGSTFHYYDLVHDKKINVRS